MKFSILVPVYNVERYLSMCIQSVIEQTYRDYELILVDDGSIDTSGKICDDYFIKDERIKVIHKKNKGVGAARNSAIEIAQGEYILFLDGDDFWNKDYLKKVEEILCKRKMDVCFGDGGCDYYDDGRTKEFTIYDSKRLLSCSIEEIRAYFWNDRHMAPAAVWHNIYNLKFIKENNLYFDEYLSWSEDEDYLYKVLMKIKSVTFMSGHYYYYRKSNIQSLTKHYSAGNVLSIMQVKKRWLDYYLQVNEKSSVKALGIEKCANNFISLISLVNSLSKEDKDKVIRWINANRYIFKYVTGSKNIILRYIYRALGIKNGSKIVCILNKKNVILKKYIKGNRR